MEIYPFVYMNHIVNGIGRIENDDECFVWFDGNLAGKERKFIRECFSSLVSDFFLWGDCFLSFRCVTDADEFNLCLEDIRKIVPIIFAVSPYAPYNWNAYSLEKIGYVAGIMLRYADRNRWILNGERKKRPKSILCYSEELINIFRDNFRKIVFMDSAKGDRPEYLPEWFERYVNLNGIQEFANEKEDANFLKMFG